VVFVADKVRISATVEPKHKAALEAAERNNSEIIRQLLDGFRKHGSVEEVVEEDLKKEIDALDDEIQAKERRKQQKVDQLERLRDDSLHPDDEQKVEEYLEEKSISNLVHLNPEFDPIKDRSDGTLSPERFVKEIAKKADSLPIDRYVLRFRTDGEMSVDDAPTRKFANVHFQEPDPEFVIELLEIRDEVLPDDRGIEETQQTSELKSAGGSQ
jgi:hypothetical protein